jgi:hypothetical protein
MGCEMIGAPRYRHLLINSSDSHVAGPATVAAAITGIHGNIVGVSQKTARAVDASAAATTELQATVKDTKRADTKLI